MQNSIRLKITKAFKNTFLVADVNIGFKGAQACGAGNIVNRMLADKTLVACYQNP